MNSENKNYSQEKIKKATEFLQKSWWFCFYLVIAPLIIAFLIIVIFIQSGVNIYISLAFSVLSFIFTLLFFFKVYDKYRRKPFFLNKENNPTARIHSLFLISIFSLIITPIFYLISLMNIPFTLLPLISYAILYNIIYYYYYLQPLDYFNLEEKEFKHTENIKLMFIQPYNFIIFLNYLIHIIFLGITASTEFSWLFSLISDIAVYILTLVSTKDQIRKIKELIAENKSIVKDLIVFKKKFVVCIVNLLFILLIQMPFVSIIMFSLRGVLYSSLELISYAFLTVIFILFYFKSRYYISVYYNTRLKLYIVSDNINISKESTFIEYFKYQKHNSYLSGVLILLITIFSFLIEIPLLNVIILPFIFILLYYEQKSDLCPKKYSRFVALLNSISILASIAFGLIPLISEMPLLNFLIFCLSLYFVLQIFARYKYFIKDDILLYQNLLAIASFILLFYSFFPIAIIEYTTFTSNPIIILISNILLHSLIILVTFLISLYILGVRYFYAKTPKSFKTYIIIISFLIELVIFALINFRNFLVLGFINFLYSLCISSILFPIVFIVFLFVNYSLNAFKLEYFLTLCYYIFWIFIVDFFISLLIISLLNIYIIVLILDCLISSIFYYFILKFGMELEKINESKFNTNNKINSYLIGIELLSLFFTIFFIAFQSISLAENLIYSLYLSLLIVGGLVNLFSKIEIFSEDLILRINAFILLYSSLIAFYFILLLTFNTTYVYIVPLLVFSTIFYLPLLFLKKKSIFKNFISKLLKVNSLLFSATLSLIPIIIGLEMFNLGLYFDLIFLIFSVINFSLYIVFALLGIYYFLLKKIKVDENRVNLILKLHILIAVIIGITTIFYYPFFLLTGTFYCIVLPLIFMFCFFYIPLFYSYKKQLFNVKLVKLEIVLITIALTGLFTSIPSIVSLDLINKSLIFYSKVLPVNIINFSFYIFFIFLLILSSLFKKLELKSKFILNLGRLQFFTIFCISITTLFFYPFSLLSGFFYKILISFIALLSSWFFIFYYAYRKEYFNLVLVRLLTIYNFTVLSCLIISLPFIIGLEVFGFAANFILIITLTLLILFVFLNIFEIIANKIKLKERYIKYSKLLKPILFFLLSLFLSYYISTIFIIRLTLTPITFLVLSCSFLVFFLLSMYTLELTFSYDPKLLTLKKYKDIIIYGIILSLSSIFTFLSISTNILSSFFLTSIIFNSSIIIGVFTSLFLLFLILGDNLIELKLPQVKIICELIAWVIIKVILCILTFFLIDVFAYQFFIVNKILLVSLIFTVLTPLSLHILKNLSLVSSKNKLLIKKLTEIVFIISLLGIYTEISYNLLNLIPLFYQNSLLKIVSLTINLILILYYFSIKYNRVLEEHSSLNIYSFYLTSFLLFFSFLYFNTNLSVFLILLSYVLILSKRSIISIFRFLSYFLLSYYTFTTILVIINFYGVTIAFNLTNLSIFINLYLLTTIFVLVFSIILNIKKNNTQEKFTLYSLISILSYVSLMNFTNILSIYNITISLFIFLFFMGIYFHHQKDERYKWFIKPCLILFIFDFISFLSYSWFFNNQIYDTYNPILTFTLTLSITGFGFVLLYNEAPRKFRKKFFYIILASIVIAFPIFIYFLMIASLSMPLLSIVPLIVAIDFGVFLFYLCIAIYHWRISWAIWKSGWYVWNILPFVNFFIIYQSFTGIDVFTDSLQFGLIQVEGSLIISMIICSLFFLPVLYTKIKKYFFYIIFIIWGESLFLLYWVNSNLFVSDLVLRNLSFVLFSVILLMPLFAGFKYWKMVSIFWLLLTIINSLFLLGYLVSIGVNLEMVISIDILVFGLFFIVYSFFPNIRSYGVILISAYLITLSGIFSTVLFIFYLLLLDPIFSVNISFIIVGLSLFSSKYLKLSNRIIDHSLSWVLIFNLAWLTFNTFNLFPGFVVFAFSLALTVFGFSFFIFNHYKMKMPIRIIIPSSIITIGASLSVTSFISLIFKASPGILISTFSSVFIVFLYFLIKEYRYLLWFGFPIPITTPILEAMLIFDVIKPFWLLTWSMLYLISFQIIINFFKRSIQKETHKIQEEAQEIKNSIFAIYKDKNQLKWFNFICFLLNSICISLFVGIILPNLIKNILFTQILIVYQICDFLLLWSLLFLLCMKYIEKSGLDVKIKDISPFFNKLSLILYIFISFASGVNLLLYLLLINQNLVVVTLSFLLLVSGIAFLEGFLLDRLYFHFLFKSIRNLFSICSWLLFSTLLALDLIFIFQILDYLNFLIVNVIIFLEVCLLFNTIKIYNNMLPDQKHPNFLEKMHSILFLLLYLEISLIILGLLLNYLGLFESILSSLLILFILTILEIHSIKKITRSYATFVHSISFILISIMLLMILNQYISQYSILLSIEFFIFVIMQFYSNFSLMKSLKLLFPQNEIEFKKLENSIQHILGWLFYGLFCFCLLQLLILQRIEFQLILLILSSTIHILMIIDIKVLKFLEKSASYIKLISWGFIMTFSSFYLIWVYNTFFISVFFTVIPLIVLILIIEFAYLFKLLSIWEVIALNKEKIRFLLVIITYINFITWPFYFFSLDPFLNFNLILIAILIMLLITLIDAVLKEKLRNLLKLSSFMIFGALLSTDLYLLLNSIPNFDIILNLSISSLIFVLFLVILVNPFKKHWHIALPFWLVIFFLLSTIINQISISSIYSIVFFVIMLLLFPFIFLLEQLKELFNWLVDTILKIFKNLKIMIKNFLLKISHFIKIHYKTIWIITNIFISVFFGILFSEIILGLLNPIHATLLIFPIFGLLYSFIPSKKSDDVDIRFQRRMIRIIISWISVIIVLIIFITPLWHIFIIWISIWIAGAILLPLMIFYERKEKISIKWRFYTLISLIILLIIFGIIFSLQVLGVLVL